MQAFGLLEALHRELYLAERELEFATGGRQLSVTNCGKCCQENVPMAMEIEVMYLLSHLQPLPKEVRERAIRWVGENHNGLQLYDGIRGRVYHDEERAQLDEDAQVLAKTVCPFLTTDKQCMVRSHKPLVCRAYGVTLAPDPPETAETRMGISAGGPRGKRIQRLKAQLIDHLRRHAPDLLATSWFPGLLARALDKDSLLALQREGKVADIKLAMINHTPSLWRDESEQDTLPLTEVAAPRQRAMEGVN